MRPGQQAEQHEHHDLREPGDGVEKDDHGIVRAGLPVADDQPGEIDREEAGRVHRVGEGEHHQRADRDERRVQALRQHEPVEHQRDDSPAAIADDAAENRRRAGTSQRVRPALVADQQDLDQQQGEKHRERIVGAGLDLERRAHARAQPQAACVDQEEHRRRVGRGHHRADQQRLHPAEPSTHLATGAVSSAVISTPTVASVTAGASTLRNVASRVRRPPSNRISASAIEPTV